MTDHKHHDDFTPPDCTETHGHTWDDQSGDGSAWAWVFIATIALIVVAVFGGMYL